jgi:hypothetical protein
MEVGQGLMEVLMEGDWGESEEKVVGRAKFCGEEKLESRKKLG